ncbi:MAG: hypothetical protein ABI432_07125 [Flavobacteriales bacterium]
MSKIERSSLRRWLFLGGALGIVLVFAGWNEATRPVEGPHGRLELALFRSLDTLPVFQSAYFWTSGRCAGCHGRDPDTLASIDAAGRDVNVVSDWRSTMMANSGRDPFFRAKVSHEVIVNPGHQVTIENKCLSCHAPLGMHDERMLGHPPFTMANMDTSTLGNDGVSCLSCHMQSQATAGTYFSGELQFDSARVYGPYSDDQINPAIMQFFVGFTPGQGTHITNSKVCAGCHTLITQTIDLDGNETGDEFVEQATYHEWLNSVYSANGTHCNTCHMPRLNEPIILAANYAFLPGQNPFGLHHLAGGNVHMLQLLKANREVLGIPASEVQFDSTIARTRAMLTQRTLDLQLTLADRTADTAFYELRLENRAGHRFPSGYPSRRTFVQFTVVDAEGDTVFSSGRTDSDYEVEGHDTPYEPHYNVITEPDQVQIYEMVMGDVNGNATTVLERAKSPIKDNRLVPAGFSMTHPSYDTTLIAGDALLDVDFNHNSLGEEGSGTDIVHYHVPITAVSSGLHAYARVFYQPVPPAWNASMFNEHSAPIDTFRDMLAATDGTPTLVAIDSLGIGPAGIAEAAENRVLLFPNPASDGWLTITATDRSLIELLGVHDARGALIDAETERLAKGWRLHLPKAPGVYFIRLRIDGILVLKSVVRP